MQNKPLFRSVWGMGSRNTARKTSEKWYVSPILEIQYWRNIPFCFLFVWKCSRCKPPIKLHHSQTPWCVKKAAYFDISHLLFYLLIPLFRCLQQIVMPTCHHLLYAEFFGVRKRLLCRHPINDFFYFLRKAKIIVNE